MVVADADIVPHAADTEAPTLLGAYQLGPVIGSGNYGCVRLATDLTDWSRWAIKIVPQRTIKNSQPEDDLASQRLEEEVRITGMLRHPNVISFREAFHIAGYRCLVSSFASGGDLMAKLKAFGRLPEDAASQYFRQLISGVRYLHAQGVVHRDLKPENLLLGENDCLMIADFGLAATFNPNESAPPLLQECCGTLRYAAPEVLRHRRYDGRAADMWSCGVILYMMLTERFPFDAPQKEQLIAKVCKGEYVPVRNVSPFAQELLAGLLVLDPSKRLTAEAALSCAWLSPEPLRRFDRRRDSFRDAPVRQAVHDGVTDLGQSPAPRPAVPILRSKTPSGASRLTPRTAAVPTPRQLADGTASHLTVRRPVAVVMAQAQPNNRTSITPRTLSSHPSSIHRQ